MRGGGVMEFPYHTHTHTLCHVKYISQSKKYIIWYVL